MIRSHNEIATMATKAARGAGAPLGHAEDFGPVVAYLAAHDAEGLSCLQAALGANIRQLDQQNTGNGMVMNAAQAVIAAPIAIDMVKAGANTVQLRDIDAPALVSAYCRLAGGVTCKIEDDYCTIWEFLAALAAKTYVPATEESRLAGAGAGLTDND